MAEETQMMSDFYKFLVYTAGMAGVGVVFVLGFLEFLGSL